MPTDNPESQTSFQLISRSFINNIESLRSFAEAVHPVAELYDTQFQLDRIGAVLAALRMEHEGPATLAEADVISSEGREAAALLDELVSKLPEPGTDADQQEEKALPESLRIIIRELATKLGAGTQRSDKSKKTGKLAFSNRYAISELTRKVKPKVAHKELLYKSALVTLVSNLDIVISDLLHYHYGHFPESLGSKDLSVPLGELKRLGSVESAIESIVDNEVERILRQSLLDQLHTFRRNLHVELSQIEPTEEDFLNEIVQRRHLLVHNAGRVNHQYLHRKRLGNTPNPDTFVEGDVVSVDSDYFKAAVDAVMVAGTILIQQCWRKWDKNSLEMADRALIDSIYDALLAERWPIAERIGRYACALTWSNERYSLVGKINYLQSLKWQGKETEVNQIIAAMDISALAPEFKLSVACLRGSNDDVFAQLPAAIKSGALSIADIETWPLFRNVRKDERFSKEIAKLRPRTRRRQVKRSETTTASSAKDS